MQNASLACGGWTPLVIQDPFEKNSDYIQRRPVRVKHDAPWSK